MQCVVDLGKLISNLTLALTFIRIILQVKCITIVNNSLLVLLVDRLEFVLKRWVWLCKQLYINLYLSVGQVCIPEAFVHRLRCIAVVRFQTIPLQR